MTARKAPLPVWFLPHGGGPCFFMDWTFGQPDTWNKLGAWLGDVATETDAVPKALLVISGHWEADPILVTGNPKPPLIYDYQGFPEHTYQIQYPASGDPALAERVVKLLSEGGVEASVDNARGFDHGVFIPMKMVYPEANIPIVQVSLRHDLDPAFHLEVGRLLAPLRKEGVLIIGSGMSFHNLRLMFDDSKRGVEQSDAFDAWLNSAVTADAETRKERLTNWRSAPGAAISHPRAEHLLPLMVAVGAAGDDPGVRAFSDRIMGHKISAWRLG